MVRPPCCDKVGVKKGPWTPEEDIILVSYIQEHGPGNWRSVPTKTGRSFILLSSYFLSLNLNLVSLLMALLIHFFFPDGFLWFLFYLNRVDEV